MSDLLTLIIILASASLVIFPIVPHSYEGIFLGALIFLIALTVIGWLYEIMNS